MSWFLEKPIAHRGWHWVDGIDENSWEAIELGVEKGHPIEFDVHLSKDGFPFIHHDLNLKRMTGMDVRGTSLKKEELKKINSFKSQKGIPFLEDVLTFVNGRVPLVIEIKRTQSGHVLERAVLETMKSYKGDYSLQAFHPQSLEVIKSEGHGAPLGLLSGSMDDAGISLLSRVTIRSLCLAPYFKPDYIGYQWDCVSQRAPQEIREQYGIPLLAWTVRDEEAALFCKRWADNIIFEQIIV